MPLLRWDPFADMAHLREEVNRLFEQSLSDSGHNAATGQTWTPAVDIYETESAIGLCIEITGMKAEDIDIQISDDTLTISGERKLGEHDGAKQYVRVERNHGAFHRSFTLGVAVDPQKVHASYRDGILEVVLPKRETPKPKQIKIEVRSSGSDAQTIDQGIEA